MKLFVLKRIHECFASESTSDVIVYFEVDVPFVPTEGMMFKGTGIPEGFFDETLSSMRWDTDEQALFAWSEDEDMERYNDFILNRPRREMDAIVKPYLDRGWKVWKGP